MTESALRVQAPSAGDQAGGSYTLHSRCHPGARPVLLTGIQAVARLIAEQHTHDTRAGRRTASLVSGKLGGLLPAG